MFQPRFDVLCALSEYTESTSFYIVLISVIKPKLEMFLKVFTVMICVRRTLRLILSLVPSVYFSHKLLLSNENARITLSTV